jgi:hypothetical protein
MPFIKFAEALVCANTELLFFRYTAVLSPLGGLLVFLYAILEALFEVGELTVLCFRELID